MGGTAPQMGFGGPTSSAVAWDPTKHAPHEARQQRVDESRVKHDYTVVHVTRAPKPPPRGRPGGGGGGAGAAAAAERDAATQARVYGATSWAEGRGAQRAASPAPAPALAPGARRLEGGGFSASTSGGTMELLAQRAAACRESASAVGGKTTAARVHERAHNRAVKAASARCSYEPTLG